VSTCLEPTLGSTDSRALSVVVDGRRSRAYAAATELPNFELQLL
jgi:hypothetical protein